MSDLENTTPVGTVNASEGPVFVTHADGSREALGEGAPIFQGDVLETAAGGDLSITFIDDSSFALGENGTMTVDEMVFDPAGGEASALVSVAKGVFVFVSGQIAKSGSEAMIVDTPVMQIGVRGTKVAGKAGPEGDDNVVTLLPEADGQIGEISVTTEGGAQILNQAHQTIQISSAFAAPPAPKVIAAESIKNLYGTTIDRHDTAIERHNAQTRQDGFVPAETHSPTEAVPEGDPSEETAEKEPQDQVAVLDEEIHREIVEPAFEERFETEEDGLAKGETSDTELSAEYGDRGGETFEPITFAARQELGRRETETAEFGTDLLKEFSTFSDRLTVATNYTRTRVEEERRDETASEQEPSATGITVHGDSGANSISGTDYADQLYGEDGNDTLFGGDGDDRLSGGTGNDMLNGGNGDDTMAGESGDDKLLGGIGADTMYGGTGADTFIFIGPEDGTNILENGTPGSNLAYNKIGDFSSGEDRIEFDGSQFGFSTGATLDSSNFVTISGDYDGTNASCTNYDAGTHTFIVDGSGRLIYDANGGGDGYTVVANVNGDAVTAADITFA